MSLSGVSATQGSSAASNVSLEDFMKVLMAQLSYQNPLKPMDNQEFLAQIAQFTSLGQTQEMNANIQTLVANQAAQQSIGLLGRTVYATVDNATVTGTVSKIELSGSTPILTLTTASGPLSNITLSQITTVQ